MSTNTKTPLKRDLGPIPQHQYEYTRAEVAEALGGISVQRVAQIEKRALEKLRLHLMARGFLKSDAQTLLEDLNDAA